MKNELPFSVLTAPTDGRDMTDEIESRLQSEGVCRLGTGTFVTHGITMPEGATLTGAGAATRLCLSPNVESGAAVRLSSFTTVKDLTIDGGLSEYPEKVGERHGILFEGNVFKDDDDHIGQIHNSTVTDCFITGFSGGGITCRHTGYHIVCALLVSNCHILPEFAHIHAH